MADRARAETFGLSSEFVEEQASGDDECDVDDESPTTQSTAMKGLPSVTSFSVLRRGSSHPVQTTPLALKAVDIMLDEAASPCGNGILLHMTELGITIEQLLLGIASRLALTSGSDDPVLLRQRSQAQRLIGYIISHRSYCRRLRNSPSAINVFENRLMQPDVVGHDVVTVTSIYREMIDEDGSNVGEELWAAAPQPSSNAEAKETLVRSSRRSFDAVAWATSFGEKQAGSGTPAMDSAAVAMVLAKVWTRLHRRLALRWLNVSCLVPGTEPASIKRAEEGVAVFMRSGAQIELWMLRQILAGATPAARGIVISLVVAVGCAAQKLANFHLAVCCGNVLRARAVTRLGASWYMVQPAVWLAAKGLLKSLRNEGALYDAQTRCALSQGRCIPHVPTLLKVVRRLCRRLPLWKTQNAEAAQAIFDKRDSSSSSSSGSGATTPVVKSATATPGSTSTVPTTPTTPVTAAARSAPRSVGRFGTISWLNMEKRSLSLQPWEALFGCDLPEMEGIGDGEFSGTRGAAIETLGRELARIARLAQEDPESGPCDADADNVAVKTARNALEVQSRALEPDEALEYMRPTALRRLQGIASAIAHEMMSAEVVQLHKRVFALHSYSTGYTDKPSGTGGNGNGGGACASPRSEATAAAAVAVAMGRKLDAKRGAGRGRGGSEGNRPHRFAGRGSGGGEDASGNAAPEKPSRGRVGGWLGRRKQNRLQAQQSAAAAAAAAALAAAAPPIVVPGASMELDGLPAFEDDGDDGENDVASAAAKSSETASTAVAASGATEVPLPEAGAAAEETRSPTEFLLDEIEEATRATTAINTGGGLVLLKEAGTLTRRIFKGVWDRICENGVQFLVQAVGSPLNLAVATDAVYSTVEQMVTGSIDSVLSECMFLEHAAFDRRIWQICSAIRRVAEEKATAEEEDEASVDMLVQVGEGSNSHPHAHARLLSNATSHISLSLASLSLSRTLSHLCSCSRALAQRYCGLRESLQSSSRWIRAISFLQSAELVDSPAARMTLLLRCKVEVVDALQKATADPDADCLVEVMVIILVSSGLRRPRAMCEGLWNMLSPNELAGERGLCLTNFISALEFIECGQLVL